MVKLRNTKEIISLLIGTRVCVIEGKWDSGGVTIGVGMVVDRKPDQIRICWGIGYEVWYDIQGYYRGHGDLVHSGYYTDLIMRGHSKMYSLSESEYNYFQLFI